MQPPDADLFAQLVAWIEAAGGQVGPLRLEHYGNGDRGLHAGAAMAAGQPVLHVPRRCMLSAAIGDASDIGRQLDAAGVRLETDHACFAAWLLGEMHEPDSFWKPFFAILPKAFPDCPLLFGEQEFSLLAGSMALRDIEQRQRMVAADYATLCRHISGFDRFGYEQFVRVFFAVTSRLFGLTINDQTVHALVPAADLLNHRHPPDVTWASDEAGEAFVMRATGAIAPGQAFHADYGNKCNSRLLLNHGFCLADNKNNTTEIDLPDAARDHPLAGLAWLYGYPGFDGTRRFRVPPSYAAWTTRQMFSFLRLSCAAGEDVQRMLRLGPDRPEIGPVSRKNETAVLLTLADACHAALASFPDALGDDLILLGSTDLPANARTCILMRSGEKQVLRAYLDLAEHGIQRLQSHPLSAAEPPATLSGFADYLDAIGKSLGSSTINPS